MATGKVLLVGNGSSLLNYSASGSHIDAFDGPVARFNDYRVSGYVPNVGSRTDWWITCEPFAAHRAGVFSRVLFTGYPGGVAEQSRFSILRTYQPSVEPISPIAAATGFANPSSGSMALRWLISEGWEVWTCGFDCFQVAPHHYWNSLAAEAGFVPQHDKVAELAYYRGLLALNAVRQLDLGISIVPE